MHALIFAFLLIYAVGFGFTWGGIFSLPKDDRPSPWWSVLLQILGWPIVLGVIFFRRSRPSSV